MKTALISISMILLSCSVLGQTTQNDTATVAKVRGVPVFVMCEPIASYDIIESVSDTDAGSLLNALSGKDTYRTIKESCSVIVENAQRKQKKGKFDFDAIIISDDGHNGTCIKFK